MTNSKDVSEAFLLMGWHSSIDNSLLNLKGLKKEDEMKERKRKTYLIFNWFILSPPFLLYIPEVFTPSNDY